jgi:hypothetical protein
MLDNGVHSAATRPLAQRGLKLDEGLLFAGRNDFHVTVVGIAHPAFQAESGSFAMDIPAKTDALNASFDEVVANHGAGLVLQKWRDDGKRNRSLVTPG